MRTTLDLDDDVVGAARAIARDTRQSLGAVVSYPAFPAAARGMGHHPGTGGTWRLSTGGSCTWPAAAGTSSW